MKLNQLNSAMGASRSEHAANISNAVYMRGEYDKLHQALYNGKKKYVVVDYSGKIINAHASAESANKAKSLLTNANGTVRHEDFLVIQDMIVEVRRRALNGIADLIAAGVSFSESIEKQLIGFENINEFQEAKQEMNPNSDQNNDTVFTEDFVPNPITHQSFSVPWRQAGFDYKRSLGMSESIRQVSERLEETLTNGNSSIAVGFNGTPYIIYGYTTHPQRGQGTISDWTLSTPGGLAAIYPELVDQLGNMVETQGGIGLGSVMVYVATDIATNLENDYKVESTDTAGSGMTIIDKMRKNSYVKDVKALEKLASGQVMLVEMTSQVIQLAVASDIITVPHIKTNPMQPQVLTTYAAMVQQIKVDSNGNTGIRHLTQ